MKKLMLAAIVGLVAATSQAYAIKWGAVNVLTPVAADKSTAETGIVGSGAGLTGVDIKLYWVSTSGDVLIDTYTTSDGKVSSTTIGDGTSSALYTAMVDDQGTSWKPQYHMVATYTTADGTYVFDGTVTSSTMIGQLSTRNVTANANFSTAGTWAYTPAAVPEPTSGLMLLLGVAGLALKRKRA